MDLPAYLIRLMEARPIQGKELARRLGVRPSFVSQVRQGTRPIPPDSIQKWIRALELTGEDAEMLRVLALVQHGPTELRTYVLELRDQLAKARAQKS